MAKSKIVYVCQECGQKFAKWQGQCDSCGQWNTLAESLEEATSEKKGKKTGRDELKEADLSKYLVKFDQHLRQTNFERFSTSMEEFDRVLGQDDSGWGMVKGSVVLIGGEPGIGKSTLLTQMIIGMEEMKSKEETRRILYVCGEESPAQIGLRIRRMREGAKDEETAGLVFVTTTDVDEIIELVRRESPRLLIVDSIQTLTTRDLLGPAGSMGQVKETAERITDCVKELNVPTMMVGHVNKEGEIAGPKTLEHIVDAILELNGERGGDLRFLRAVKNRFGATDEIGVFRLIEGGIEEIKNPSALFLEQTESGVAGNSVVCAMEGTRPILTEVQALVVESQLAMPRRVGRGVDLARIQILAAVLQKRAGIPLGMNDVFLSVAGGMTIRESAIELGLAVAMASSFCGVALDTKVVFIGEIGLMGEIRTVNNLDRRIKEAKRLGYAKVYSRKTHRNIKDLFRELKLTKNR